MEIAINNYKLVPCNFGMAKSLMMYVQIDVSKHFKDLLPDQIKKLEEKLALAEESFDKLGREKQKVICTLLKAKVIMAGKPEQKDRDKAIKFIRTAE